MDEQKTTDEGKPGSKVFVIGTLICIAALGAYFSLHSYDKAADGIKKAAASSVELAVERGAAAINAKPIAGETVKAEADGKTLRLSTTVAIDKPLTDIQKSMTTLDFRQKILVDWCKRENEELYKNGFVVVAKLVAGETVFEETADRTTCGF